MTKINQELEDIFLDTIIMRVEQIQNLGIRHASFSSTFANNAYDYEDNVQTLCDIILQYIREHEHMVKQEDNYKQIMLDTLFKDEAITSDVYGKYSLM